MFLGPCLRGCKAPECGHGPIRLPFPTLPLQDQRPPEWPRETWSTVFACPVCGRTSSYSEQDIDWALFQSPNPSQPLADADCWHIETECAVADCKSPIGFHALVDAGKGVGAIPALLSRGFFRATCEFGHSISRQQDSLFHQLEILQVIDL